MNKVERVIDHATQSCKARGSRLTDKRKQVLLSLLKAERAMSAYELVDYCKEEYGQSISPMSVYRILDFLQDEHLIHKLHLANKYVVCSHITCDHTHDVPQFLICGRCQKVKEISINKSVINNFQQNVKEAGFQLVSPQLEMDCICESCIASAV